MNNSHELNQAQTCKQPSKQAQHIHFFVIASTVAMSVVPRQLPELPVAPSGTENGLVSGDGEGGGGPSASDWLNAPDWGSECERVKGGDSGGGE